MKMYPTFADTQQCIWNNKVILTQVVIEWKRQEQNKSLFKGKIPALKGSG